MRPQRFFTAALVLVLWPAVPVSPGAARLATFETTAPLQGSTEHAVKTALREAAETAVKAAVAMGLP